MRGRFWRSVERLAVGTESVVKAFLLFIVLNAFASSAAAQSLQVIGYVGLLGEWELTATVTRADSDYSGPFTMKHIGLCTQDGPEEKTGEMRLHVSASLSELRATLLEAGVECAYSGKLTDFYTGIMSCPDRQVPLKLWLR
jgi:hypothetical protein